MIGNFVRLAGGPLGLVVTVAQLVLAVAEVANALGGDDEDDDEDEEAPSWG